MDYSCFEDLHLEHRAFQFFLDQAKEALPPWDRLGELAFLLDEVHHAKEENLLFPLLFGSAAEDRSGPKCSTFFTPRVMNACAWQDSFHALRVKLGGAPAQEKQSAFREKAFASGGMIRIPLEDHLIGEEAMARMLRSEAEYREIFPFFSRMLREHIEREDECLFPLLKSVLGEEQKRLYAEAAAALDRKLGTARRLKELKY